MGFVPISGFFCLVLRHPSDYSQLMQLIINTSFIARFARAAVISTALVGINACTPRESPVVEEDFQQVKEQITAEEQPSTTLVSPKEAAPVTIKAPPPELDLSREHIETIVAETDDNQITEANYALPDLFSQGQRDKRLSVNGRLLTKDEADSMLDTLDGAEIKLEIKTQ